MFKLHVNLYLFVSNRNNMAKGGGICVANHTSPIDVLILACENCYSMVCNKENLMRNAFSDLFYTVLA